MSDLDERLLEAIYKGVSLNKLDEVPENSTNWFKASRNGDVYEFVLDPEPIKQAFIDAGYVQAFPQGRIDNAINKTIDQSYRMYGLMTGQDWYERFERELLNSTDEGDLLWHELYYDGKREYDNEQYRSAKRVILGAAKKVAGLE